MCPHSASSLIILVFFQAEDGIRDLVRSRGLGDVYKRQVEVGPRLGLDELHLARARGFAEQVHLLRRARFLLSLIHI